MTVDTCPTTLTQVLDKMAEELHSAHQTLLDRESSSTIEDVDHQSDEESTIGEGIEELQEYNYKKMMKLEKNFLGKKVPQ